MNDRIQNPQDEDAYEEKADPDADLQDELVAELNSIMSPLEAIDAQRRPPLANQPPRKWTCEEESERQRCEEQPPA